MACFPLPPEDGGAGCWRVDRKLLPVKGFYLVFYAAIGSLLPFIAVYMKHLGLTSNETGIIYGVMPFLSFLVRPMVGAAADKWLKHKLLLILCTLLTAVFYLLIMFVPSRIPPTTVHVHPVVLRCLPEGSALTACSPSITGKGEDFYETESTSAHHRACSVPLITLAKQFLRANTFAEDDSLANESASEQVSVASVTEMRSLVNTSSHSSRQAECSLTCHPRNENVTAAGTVHEKPSSSFCFTNRQEELSARCQGIQSDVLPLTLNVTSLPGLFSVEPGAYPGEPADMEECHRAYPLTDIQSGGQTFTSLTCPQSTSMVCRMSCTGVTAARVCGRVDAVQLDVTFSLMAVVSFFAAATFSPVSSLMDAVTFNQLGDQRHKYGQQRMWGTLGLALLAITTTFTMNPGLDDDPSDVNYDVMFYLFSGLCLLSALVAASLRISSRVRCQRLLKNACGLLMLPEVVAFLTVVMYLGMVSGAIEGFLFWYLADLGATPLLFGLCLVVNCAFEIPFFFFSGAILQRWPPVACLYASMLVLSARLLGYSLLGDPWHVLLAEALHGVTFGVMWSAVANHADVIAPPGMAASVQGLVGGVNGVGRGLGSLLTGLLFGVIGERWTFRALALTCLALLALYALLNTLVFAQRPQPHSEDMATGGAEKNGEDISQNQKFLNHVPDTTTDTM